MTDEELLREALDEGLLARPAGEVQRLAKRCAKSGVLRRKGGQALKVAVLSTFLADYLCEVLPLFLARRGFAAELYQGAYGQVASEILDTGSGLRAFGPDLVLILPTHRDLTRVPALGADAEQARAAAREEAGFWQGLWKRLDAPVLQLSFDPPALRPLGELDGFAPGGALNHARRVNLAMADDLPGHVQLLDAEALALRCGQAQWHDARLYHLCKQPFSFDVLPQVADALAAAAAGALGRGRKALILDLDNTLWGGIIGDDGLEGVALGPETPEGEAFTAFQRYAAQLGRRGVILAVCSKNNAEVARRPFREHSGMALSEEDIACFVANFEDKATNIRRIAATLNLGLDAFVFVDDNPVERAWVKAQLPEVRVLEIPEEPAEYARALDAANAFPIRRLTGDDLLRGKSYKARAAVEELKAECADMDSFLASLEQTAVVEPVSPSSIDRIVQLVAKTNQFKPNKRAFTLEEISARPGDVIALRLRDRIQDYGIVSVAVSRCAGDVLEVENWVMSCRVFCRRLENVMQLLLAERARSLGAGSLAVEYAETPKNGLLKDVFPALGYALDGGGRYVAPARPAPELSRHHMTVIGA